MRLPLKLVVTLPPMARATRRRVIRRRAQSMSIVRVPRTVRSDRTVRNFPRPALSTPIPVGPRRVARQTTRATIIRIRRRRPCLRSRVNQLIIPRPIIRRPTTPRPIILNSTLGRILTPFQERLTIRRRFPPSIPVRSIVPLHNSTSRTIRPSISRRTRQTMPSILSDHQFPSLRGIHNTQLPHQGLIIRMELAHPMSRLRILPTLILRPPR